MKCTSANEAIKGRIADINVSVLLLLALDDKIRVVAECVRSIFKK